MMPTGKKASAAPGKATAARAARGAAAAPAGVSPATRARAREAAKPAAPKPAANAARTGSATKSPSPPPQPARPAHRPAYIPTEKDKITVRVMVAGGIERLVICAVLGVSEKTLRKHFRREIDTAAAEANAQVVASLFRMATNGNVHAAKWWTQSRMGWTERLTLVDGGDEVDPATMTDAEIYARLAKLRRTATVARAMKGGTVVPFTAA